MTDRRFPDEQARRIIEHALELADRSRGTMSVTDIRAVLTEMDVPLEIQEHALRAGAAQQSVPPLNAPASPTECGTFGVTIGAATAMAMSFVPEPLVVAPALLALGVMYSGVLAARTDLRRPDQRRRFQIANVLVWGGMGGGFIAIGALAQSLYAAASTQLSPWVFPLAWVFTSVTGVVLSRHEGGDGGSMADRSVVVRIGRRMIERIRELVRPLAERGEVAL